MSITTLPLDLTSTPDLVPHLLYHVEADQGRFATWRLNEGHEALAIFTTAETANNYLRELSAEADWIVYQPPRDKLIEILQACRSTGILYAALDPLVGTAKTLFDIPRVLAAAVTPESGKK
jgi:hypothetical protein